MFFRFLAFLRSCFHRFRGQNLKKICPNAFPNGIWWLHGAICLARRAPRELLGAVEGSLGAKMGAQGCLKKPEELPRRPQEHKKQPQNMEITIHRPCRRFRASQVTIYRPCRVIMSAEKRSMGRPGHDPSALSTFQSLKVLRIRVLEGWRPPSSIHSSFLSLPGVPWDPCILILPVSQPNVTRAFGHHFCQKKRFRLDGSSISDFLEKRPLPRLTKVSLFPH